MIAIVGPLHPALLGAGLAAGLVALVIAFGTKQIAHAVDLAAVAGAIVLVATDHASPLLIVGVAIAAAGWDSGDSAHSNLGLLIPAFGLAVAGLAISDGADWSRAVVDLGGLVLLWVARRLPGPSMQIVGAVLVGGALAATWAGAPDTEAAVVTAGAVLPALALTSIVGVRRPQVAPNGSWTAALVLVLWAAGDGYRGRPAGLAATIVTLAALVFWGGEAGRRRAGRRPMRTPTLAVLVVLWLGGMVLAARTVGLADRASGSGNVVAAIVFLAAIVSAALRPHETTAAAGTSPA